jgi:aryl-phospho-beta-D-glucosidase BglC (GH1 family)
MFKFNKTTSPRLIQEALTELMGPDEVAAFWKKYLANYITEADIHYLKSIGMNSIRVPFNYRLFTEEEYLGGHGEARAFALMDRLVDWCRKENLYIILDMHCAPGVKLVIILMTAMDILIYLTAKKVNN